MIGLVRGAPGDGSRRGFGRGGGGGGRRRTSRGGRTPRCRLGADRRPLRCRRGRSAPLQDGVRAARAGVVYVAFSLATWPPTFTTTLPPTAFSGAAAMTTLDALARAYPDRRPGSAGDQRFAVLHGRGLAGRRLRDDHRTPSRATRSTGVERWRRWSRPRQGAESPSIVIVAHRDSAHPGSLAELSGSAALLELAHVFSETTTKPAADARLDQRRQRRGGRRGRPRGAHRRAGRRRDRARRPRRLAVEPAVRRAVVRRVADRPDRTCGEPWRRRSRASSVAAPAEPPSPTRSPAWRSR